MERNVLYTISVSLKLNFYGSFSLDFFGEEFWVTGKLGLSTTSYIVAGAREEGSFGGKAPPGSVASALIRTVLENLEDFFCSGQCASGLPPGITVPCSFLK